MSAGDDSDSLEELPKFAGKTVCPNMLVFIHFHQVLIFKDIACVVVNDGANEVNGGAEHSLTHWLGWKGCSYFMSSIN